MNDDAGYGFRGEYRREGNKFIKTYPADVDAEFEKAVCLHRLSLDSELFVAPKPMKLDAERNEVTYEYSVPESESIREIFIRALRRRSEFNSAARVFFEIGRLLAVLHRHLSMSTASDWAVEFQKVNGVSVDICIDPSAPMVYLHGDFGFSNLYLLKSDSATGPVCFWVIDPSPNYFVTYKPDSVGPPEVDFANLALCLHGLIPMQRQFFCNWSVSDKLLEQFLRGYSETGPCQLDRRLILSLVQITLERYTRVRMANNVKRRLARQLISSRINHSSFYRGVA